MIMPASANITRAKQLEPTHPTVEGPVIERPAVVGKCDNMCVTGRSSYLASMSRTLSLTRQFLQRDRIPSLQLDTTVNKVSFFKPVCPR
jgi:hypothetical protein